MLPGLRFLFAATLISTSLLVFGMGAIALMRASHQQFASLPPRQPPEPVFAQAPQTVPSLSMLRAEPAPPSPQTVMPEPERAASLTNAERAVEPLPPPPILAEPKPAGDTSPDTRSDVVPADPPPMPEVTPLAEQPADPEAPEVSVAEAPAAAPTMPAAPSPQIAAAPDAVPPAEITGSVTPPDPPLVAAKPVIDPPLPQARPGLVALPPKAEVAPAKAAPKFVAKRKVRQAKRSKRGGKVEKLPAATSGSTLGSLFGGGSN